MKPLHKCSRHYNTELFSILKYLSMESATLLYMSMCMAPLHFLWEETVIVEWIQSNSKKEEMSTQSLQDSKEDTPLHVVPWTDELWATSRSRSIQASLLCPSSSSHWRLECKIHHRIHHSLTQHIEYPVFDHLNVEARRRHDKSYLVERKDRWSKIRNSRSKMES